MAKPFIKWAGGKRQLMPELLSRLPKKYNAYYEPFLGGGALMYNIESDQIFINDLTDELYMAYTSLKWRSTELIKLLEKHQSKHSEEYFFKIRNIDRDEKAIKKMTRTERAARFIYLNRTAFNGMWRENKKGHMNVPFNKNPKCNFDWDNLRACSRFLRKHRAKISNKDFELSLKGIKKNDFVYFDPPYDTWDKPTFESYNKDGFGVAGQERLANLCRELDKKGVKFMASNHNTKLINELYKGFKIEVVRARRSISSKASTRGKVEEVLIRNY